MKALSLAACTALAALAGGEALATEIYQFDRNQDGHLDADEIRVMNLHKTDPIYAKIDVIVVDGKFSPEELNAFYASSEKKLKPSPLATQAATSGPVPLPNVYDVERRVRCAHDRFYVRGGAPIVGLQFGQGASFQAPPTADRARNVETGALFSITEDRENDITTAAINGVAGFVMTRNCNVPADDRIDQPYFSGYVLSPWVLANGTLSDNDDLNGTDVFQAGFAAQVGLVNAGFAYQTFTATPYYQTDFQGEAEIYGGSLTWRPFDNALRLGGSPRRMNSMLDLYWTAAATADLFHVVDPGFTSLVEDSGYAWLGGAVGINGWILPAALDDRLTFTTAYGLFWDANSGQSVDNFQASLNLSLLKKADPNQLALNLTYVNGTDRNTLIDKEQWTLGLTFKH